MNRKTESRAGKARRIRKALAAIAALLLAAGLLVLCRTLVNRVFRISYENENYAEYPEKLLLPLAFGDNYVVPYNLGCAAYQRADFSQAEEYFTRALESGPPEEEKECAVRINLALSVLHGFPFDTLDPGAENEVRAALDTLRKARAALTETGCACESADRWNGHSAEAESLKRDIDDMIRKLTAAPAPGGESGNGPPEESGGDGSDPPQDAPEGGSPPQEQPGREGEDSMETRQQSLEQSLKEQKQSLESGTYRNGDNTPFTYIETGETVGFGEGMPW